MYKLDTKSDEVYFILYKDNQKHLKFSKRVNTLEQVTNVLKSFYKIDFEII